MPAFYVNYRIANLIGFGGALILCTVLARRTRSWLTHAHLFSAFWGANILVSQVALGGILRPEVHTLFVLFFAWWFFLAGTLLIIGRRSPGRRRMPPIHRRRAVTILLVLVALQGIAVALEMGSIGQGPVGFFRDFVNNAIRLRLENIAPTSSGHVFSSSLWRWDQVLYIPLALLLHSRSMISGKFLTAIYA